MKSGHRRHRVGAKVRDHEDVHYSEDALHDLLEHHRHREDEDGAPDGTFGEIPAVGAAQRLANRRPDGGPGLLQRACRCAHPGLGSTTVVTMARARCGIKEPCTSPRATKQS